jgi:low affinity Fe/Cu permease
MMHNILFIHSNLYYITSILVMHLLLIMLVQNIQYDINDMNCNIILMGHILVF